MRVSARHPGIASLALLPLLCACGGGSGTPTPRPTVIVGTPTVNAVALQVQLAGQPTRTFGQGHWHVCDRGTVTNPSSLVAHDVRLTVTYVDHGIVDGRTTLADAAKDGGALGDLQPGEQRSFTICGSSRNEPDQDVVSATPAT